VIYGIRLLEILRDIDSIETHVVISSMAAENIKIETHFQVQDVENLADVIYDCSNLAASISSGSFLTAGMIVIPCSMKSLSGIVNCHNDNLLIRAADVTLKEGRKLVVSPRETPLHKGHLELMLKFVDHGGVLVPPFPAFYSSPKTITDIIDHTLGKILDQFEIKHDLFKRWSGKSIV